MQKIKIVLSLEISQECINWQKLSMKIHSALKLVDNKFQNIMQNEKYSKVKMDDALTFRVVKDNIPFCYKIFSPRFYKRELYCCGLQIGTYSPVNNGIPEFIEPPRMF